MKNLSNT